MIIDGIINLVLGILLLLVPFGMASILGVPEPVSYLYPCVLGAVLFGIGIALLLEVRSGSKVFVDLVWAGRLSSISAGQGRCWDGC